MKNKRDPVGATGFEAAPESAPNAGKNAVSREPSPAPVAEPSRLGASQSLYAVGLRGNNEYPLAGYWCGEGSPPPPNEGAIRRARPIFRHCRRRPAMTRIRGEWRVVKGTWIPYPGQVTLRVNLPKGNTRPVVLVAAEIATAPNYPDCATLDTMTTNAGQEFELLQVDQTGFTALNNGCAAYCARFVVTLGDSDGGADASADVDDAGRDGGGQDGGHD